MAATDDNQSTTPLYSPTPKQFATQKGLFLSIGRLSASLQFTGISFVLTRLMQMLVVVYICAFCRLGRRNISQSSFQRVDQLMGELFQRIQSEGDACLKKALRSTKNLSSFNNAYGEYLAAIKTINEIQEIAQNEKDASIVELFREELKKFRNNQTALFCRLKEPLTRLALVEGDDQSDNAIGAVLEIRAGTGGAESAIFAKELFEMYLKYCQKQGWPITDQSIQQSSTSEGIREGIVMVKGYDSFKWLKWEGGVHRVQRVPETESQGRLHTSTVTVAVFPKLEETHFEVLDSDLRYESFKSGGPGGQHVNKTNSAVRITHIPTGLSVAVQEERCAQMNKDRALSILHQKLSQIHLQKIATKIRESRKDQIGSSDRSEKFRTYNFPQSRITDHRIGKSIHDVEKFMSGSLLGEFLSLLQENYENKILEEFLLKMKRDDSTVL